jgi:hypothetical protein
MYYGISVVMWEGFRVCFRGGVDGADHSQSTSEADARGRELRMPRLECAVANRVRRVTCDV